MFLTNKWYHEHTEELSDMLTLDIWNKEFLTLGCGVVFLLRHEASNSSALGCQIHSRLALQFSRWNVFRLFSTAHYSTESYS